MPEIVEKLLSSTEPSIVYKTRTLLLREKPTSAQVAELQENVRSSNRVRLLLSVRDREGRIPLHPYRWYGAHWVLVALAELGYPSGDDSLVPLREQVFEWLLSAQYEGALRSKQIRYAEGFARIHASMEGNAIYALSTLGLDDERVSRLLDRLIRLQWPDGGWNCDVNPEAAHSSFMETLIPLRAMALHAKLTGSKTTREAAARASEVFLSRRLFKKRRDGKIMRKNFTLLHYPYYWHYDILFGLKVMAEAGFIRDERCNDALDLLESKRLPDGGFPAEAKYWTTTHSIVDWGGTSTRHMNEFVTVDALYVLKEAGRLSYD